MRKILFFLPFLALMLQIQPAKAEGMNFLTDWDKALAEAKKTDRLIFLDAYTTWCGPCKWMAANVMTQDEVGKFYNTNFVNLKLDMEKGVGKEIAAQFKVGVYPTLAFFDGDGRMVWRAIGALEVEPFIALGQKVLDGVEPVQDLYDTYASGKYDRDFLYKYLVHCNEGGLDYSAALDEYREGMELEDLLTEQGWDIFKRFFKRIDSEEFAYFEKHMGDFEEEFGKEEVEKTYLWFYIKAFGQAIYKKDADAVRKISKKLEGKGDEEIQENYHDMAIGWAMASEEKEDAYQMVTEWVRDGRSIHWSSLNTAAWDVYEKEEDPAFIDMALAWVERSIELDRNTFNLDTKAMLLYKGGNLDQAILTAREAIEVAEETGEDGSGTEKALEKMLQEKEDN